jgi:hypothetical protein
VRTLFVEAAVKNSLSHVLFIWLHERRIVADLARHMGIDKSTLSAKLSPRKNRARLAADDLIPLFDAIREIGYGKELSGILHPFLEAMQGTDPVNINPADQVAQLAALGKGVSTLFDCAARVPQMKDPEELRRLKIQVRTEVLPLVLQMEAILDQRLQKVTKAEHVHGSEPHVELKPQLSR